MLFRSALRQLNDKFYNKLNKKAELLYSELNQFFRNNDIEAHVSFYNGMMSIRFRKEAVFNYEDAKKAMGAQQYSDLFRHLLNNNIYFPPADLEAFFISSVHSQKDLNKLIKEIKIYFLNQTKG